MATSNEAELAMIDAGTHPLLQIFISNDDGTGRKNMYQWVYNESRTKKVPLPPCAAKAPPSALRVSVPNPQITTRPRTSEAAARPSACAPPPRPADAKQQELATLCSANTVCFGIQRDFDSCSSLEAKATMIEKLSKIFDIESDGLHERTTKQLSDIMRFLEIQWDAIGETKAHKETQ